MEKTSVTKKGTGAAQPPRPRGPLPGDLLDERYLLKDLLGHGGMGRVFTAKHLTLDERCAVKVLKDFSGYDEEGPERFLREARINAKLKHPNVVSITDAGVTKEGYHYLVMELLEGETLADWIARRPPQLHSSENVDELIGHLLGVCEGLREAHRQNIVHRDIKPCNIYLARCTVEGETRTIPKLLDFGLSKYWNDHGLTKTGTFRGSLYYVSPEQAHIGFADARSDIFSLGAVLFHGLTGQTIFEENSQQLIIARLVNDSCPVPKPSEVNPGVPKALDRICLKALERNPNKRYQTVDELMEDLSNLPRPLFRPSGQTTPVKPKPSHREPREEPHDDLWEVPKERVSHKLGGRPLIWAFALLGCLVGIAAVQYALRGKPEPREPLGSARSAKSEPPPPRTTAVEVAGAPARPQEAGAKLRSEKTKAKDKAPRRPSKMKTQKRAPRAGANGRPRPNRSGEKRRAGQLIKEGFEALGAASFDRADRAFTEALDISPGRAEARFGLGKSAYNRGEYARAAAEIEKALELSDRPKWRLLLGQAHLASGEVTAAVDEWQRVVEGTSPESKANIFAKRLIKKHAR